ncbi:MAG: arylsulfatase [Pirellulaceae bacterium]|nr:MAG: arylsulfatase [Pirellulaceae bacterium]
MNTPKQSRGWPQSRLEPLATLWGRLSGLPGLIIAVTFGVALLPGVSAAAGRDERLPNIIIILADDLGYGDLRCYNDQAKVDTPNLDLLARRGMRFTDAHSPATVCTPSRYGLLTGQMAFRIPRGGTVFTGVGGPSLIAADRLTLAKMLKRRGYATAAVGKWHLGLTFFDHNGRAIHQGGKEAVLRVDWSRAVRGGPLDCGFDYFFGTACCPTTDWLYAFIEGDRVPVPPTGTIDKSGLPRHPYAQDCRPGFIAPGFPMEEVDLVFLEKSRQFLREHVRRNPSQPFFLYHATQAVHLPSFAAPRFQGKSGAGPHGDFLHELDWIVGQLLDTVDELGVANETVVFFSSDNGPETTAVVHMRSDYGHDGARRWRGMKRDQWEGGHRVPFIACWPGKIPPGSICSHPVCLTDLLATVAELVAFELPHDAAEDSFSILPLLLGRDSPAGRPYLLHQAAGASFLAIRRGPWKYLDHPGSGGNRYENNPLLQRYRIADTAPDAPGQLYNLELDPGETKNLYFEKPEIVQDLKQLLEKSKSAGRSRP